MSNPPRIAEDKRAASTLRAILTDVQLLVPLGVLVTGIGILIYCAR